LELTLKLQPELIGDPHIEYASDFEPSDITPEFFERVNRNLLTIFRVF